MNFVLMITVVAAVTVVIICTVMAIVIDVNGYKPRQNVNVTIQINKGEVTACHLSDKLAECYQVQQPTKEETHKIRKYMNITNDPLTDRLCQYENYPECFTK